MTMLTLLCLTNGFQVFFPGNFSSSSFLAAYITLPLFFALYFGHKLWARTPWVRRVETVDLWSGKEATDRQEEEDRRAQEEGVGGGGRSLGKRVWDWVV